MDTRNEGRNLQKEGILKRERDTALARRGIRVATIIPVNHPLLSSTESSLKKVSVSKGLV